MVLILLFVFLTSPDGTRVELFTDVGGGGDDFTGTTLDDEAGTSIALGSAPFSGSFQPEGSLSDFDGEDAQGTWTLEITDEKRREWGWLLSPSLDIAPAVPIGPTLSIDDVSLPEGNGLPDASHVIPHGGAAAASETAFATDAALLAWADFDSSDDDESDILTTTLADELALMLTQ